MYRNSFKRLFDYSVCTISFHSLVVVCNSCDFGTDVVQ